MILPPEPHLIDLVGGHFTLDSSVWHVSTGCVIALQMGRRID
jgi:hypothetical protein